MLPHTALLVSRVACMFILLIGTLAFGISPIFVQRTLFRCDCSTDICKPNCRARRGKLVTAFLIYFGGGILLGTTFLHLLPEAREGFEEHDHGHNCTENATDTDDDEGGHEHHESFPMPEFIVCLGFFAVYLFEEIVHHFLGGHTHVPTENRAIRTFSRSGSCSPPPSFDVNLTNSDKRGSGPEVPAMVRQPSLTASASDPHDHHALPTTLSLGAVLTVAALSFHSLFEGFAVGLRPDAVSTWIVFAAIAVHKYVIAFVVGLQVLTTGGKNLQVYCYMGVFALMSPLGMAIAMITESNVEDSSPLVVSVLNAIATGTLLYVTFFEILQRQEEKDIATWVQLLATSAGFVVMCFMQFGSTFA